MAERKDDRPTLQRDLQSDPSGEAETVRIASGKPNEGATEATEAETPDANLRKISDPSPGAGSGEPDEADEALERATAVLGSEDAGKSDD